jgi:hypothetical protein
MAKTITQIRKEARQKKEERDTWRVPPDLEIIKAFIYKNCHNESVLSIDIYDKKLKKMFIGNIQQSTWTRQDKLIEDNPTSNYIKKRTGGRNSSHA